MTIRNSTAMISILVTAALVCFLHPTPAAVMSASLTAPTVNGEDIANYGTVTGTDKWWNDAATSGRPKGQTFTTGNAAVRLRSITYQVSSTHQAEPTKTYVIRVGTISKPNPSEPDTWVFTEIHSETATQSFTWNANEYMTWTFDSPVLLSVNTEYGIDVGMLTSSSEWRTGIPYLNRTADEYPGGTRYMSGTTGLGLGDTTMNNASGDMLFHIGLEPPIDPVFDFVSGFPADDAVDALVPNQLVATFSQNIMPGTGNITVRNLTDLIDTVLPVGDAQVSISGNLLIVTPASPLLWSKDYAVQIDPGAIASDTGTSFAGITNDTTWNFTTAASDPLLSAISDLKHHINGTHTLDSAQIEARKFIIDGAKVRFPESASTLTAVFDLVETYDNVIGPLWIARGQFDRDNQPNDLDWTIYHVMQNIVDVVYTSDTLASHAAVLNGFKFGSSAHFPGAVDPPVNSNVTHTASITGSFPDTFGRITQGDDLPARKPTGCYLAPGTIATVTVPPSLVGRGYQVRIGAHSWDLSHRRWVRRLDRSTILYDLDTNTIQVASPLGGGIYIEVPRLADAGVVNVDITGAVRSPYFSAKSFHTTTLSEWLDTERHHPAPWADFQSDKFMMQVPTSWIYNLADPVTLKANWDAAMDAINDLMGFPHIRGKETMYPQVDVLLRSSVHAPGYPSVNVTYDPDRDYGGNHGYHLVTGPQFADDVEFHEQGHAYFFPKFPGERESNVNLLHVAVLHGAFGYDLDHAFRTSLGFGGNPHRNLDNTAVTWMTVFNFSPREVPMADGEKAYQLKGHAKFVDLVRLFGWDGLNAFWYSFNEDEEAGRAYATDIDSLLLRLCQSVGRDIRPLFHFWGIHPQNSSNLAAAISAEGLAPSHDIYQLLHHYKSLVPADNASFQAFAFNWWGRQPRISGYWTEREHARQWDTEVLWDTQERPNGEIFDEAASAAVRARVQSIIDIYYPSDYHAWAAIFPDADLSDPTGDFDLDGLNNNEERIWGLNPTDVASTRPINTGLEMPSGTFTYTRRNQSLTGIVYNYEYATTLDGSSWTPFTPALEASDGGSLVETVTVTVNAALLGNPQLFVRVVAN